LRLAASSSTANGFLAGIFFFSGSLHLLAVANVFWLGSVTPVGGVSFLFGRARLIFKQRA
jgi:uncharacterized membrane protein YgdD (TMEM256/DUF423 family)